MKSILIFTTAVLASTAFAQQKSLQCDPKNNSFNQSKMVTHCEMREQTVAFGGRLSVDPGQNGGVSIKAWDQQNVLVRSKVESAAADDGSARAVGAQIRIETSGGGGEGV